MSCGSRRFYPDFLSQELSRPLNIFPSVFWISNTLVFFGCAATPKIKGDFRAIGICDTLAESDQKIRVGKTHLIDGRTISKSAAWNTDTAANILRQKKAFAGATLFAYSKVNPVKTNLSIGYLFDFPGVFQAEPTIGYTWALFSAIDSFRGTGKYISGVSSNQSR